MKHARTPPTGVMNALLNPFVRLGMTGKLVASAAVACLAATPFGAWADVSEQKEPLTVGEPVEVGPFEVTINEVLSAKSFQHVNPVHDDDKLLIVVVEAKNITDTPASVHILNKALFAPRNAGIVDPYPSTPGAPEDGEPTDDGSGSGAGAQRVPDDLPLSERPRFEPHKMSDGDIASTINPGLTSDIALVWNQDGKVKNSSIDLELTELFYAEYGEHESGILGDHWTTSSVVTHRGAVRVTTPRESFSGAHE